MAADTDFDAMADACIKAAEHTKCSGSAELKAVMRVLLYILAGEMTGRAKKSATSPRLANGDTQTH